MISTLGPYIELNSVNLYSTFDHAAGRRTKNDPAPSSDRLGRAIDTCFRFRTIILHHTIDSGGSGGDPWTVDPKVQHLPNFLKHLRISGT